MPEDDTKLKVVSINSVKKEDQGENVYEEERKEAMLDHLDTIVSMVVEGQINQLITVLDTTDPESNCQIAISGDAVNPYKTHYDLFRNVPVLYESIFLLSNYELEE